MRRSLSSHHQRPALPFLQAASVRQKEAPAAMCRSFSGLLVLATDTPPFHNSGTWSITTFDSGDSVLKRLFPPANTIGHAGLSIGHAGAASAAPGSSGGRRRSCRSDKCSSAYHAEFGKLVLRKLNTASLGSPEHGPLLLPQSPDHTSLSQLVGAWSENSFQRGLLWAPPLLAVVLGRWSAGHKIHTAVSLSEVNIPVWEEGQTRTWYRYKVRAGVFHIGAEATSGHYRSFWFSPPHEALMTGDDAVRPSPASASDAKRVREGSCLLFLVRQ